MAVPNATDPVWEGRGRLNTIRIRLAAGLLVPFAAMMGVSAIQGFWPGGPAGRLPATLVLIAAAVILPAFMAATARTVLRSAAAIDAERNELVELYNRARLDAMLDGLTGLGNHRAFQDELARQLDGASRDGTALALLLVDVDDLKKVNDGQGHVAGDDLLVAVGRIAARVLRRTDRAFRVGGDEFAILLPSSDIETGLSVARRMLASALGGGDPTHPTKPFSLSIGVTAVPNPTTEARHLYRDADAALYWCKRHGRTAVISYDTQLHGGADDQRSVAELTAGIEAILTSRAVRPVYQPIFSMTTGEPIGFEGLVRPTDGAAFSNAGSMFTAAEAADRIVELDLLCLESVIAGIGDLEPGVYVSVNLSPRTLESGMFHPSELKAMFRRYAIPLEQVVLELTEREEVQDLDQLRRNVDACRRAGMRIAADDVGAGNAGLRLLSEVQFDIVKIDLSLVQGGVLHDPSHAVLRAIQELAAGWHASVVAEGVETAEQLAVVRALGITSGQGYLLGRPSAVRAADPLDLDALSGPVPLSTSSSPDLAADAALDGLVLADRAPEARLSA